MPSRAIGPLVHALVLTLVLTPFTLGTCVECLATRIFGPLGPFPAPYL